jgi:hypothetical protein
MRHYRFVLMLVSITSRSVAAQADIFVDDGLDELNGASEWDQEVLDFNQYDDPYPLTEEALFLDTDPYPLELADITSACTDTNQSPSRVRARAEYCSEGDFPFRHDQGDDDLTIPSNLWDSDKPYCANYKGLLDIPVCSFYEEIQIIPSDLTDFDTGQLLSKTGLKHVLSSELSRCPQLLH